MTDTTSTSTLNLSNGSTWNLTANSNLTNVSNNASLIAFASPGAGGFKTLTVQNYSGAGGVIALNTVLGTDGSASDKLVVSGGTATGTTLQPHPPPQWPESRLAIQRSLTSRPENSQFRFAFSSATIASGCIPRASCIAEGESRARRAGFPSPRAGEGTVTVLPSAALVRRNDHNAVVQQTMRASTNRR